MRRVGPGGAGALALAALVLLSAGCGGGSRAAAGAPAPSRTPLLPPSSPSPSRAPSPSAAPPATAAADGPGTAADLPDALLGVSDLGSGYAVLPPGLAPLTASSRLATCRDLVSLLNEHAAPGSGGTARVGLDGGDDLMSVDERLDLLPTGLAPGDRLITEVVAVRTCPTVQLRPPGSGPVAFTVQEVSFTARGGGAGYAARLSGTGDADGLQFFLVGAGAGRVLAHVVTDGEVGDTEDVVAQALDKIRSVGSSTGTGGGSGAPA